MSLEPGQEFPTAAVLAIVGGFVAVLSLLLPWFVFDEAGVDALVRGMDAERLAQANSPMVQAGMQASIEMVKQNFHGTIPGYEAYRMITVAFHALAAAKAIGWGIERYRGGGSSHLDSRLAAGAFVLMARPLYAFASPPGDAASRASGLNIHVIVPTAGVFVSLVGALMVVGALVLDRVNSKSVVESSPVQAQPGPLPTTPAPKPFMPGGAHVPGFPAGPGLATAAHAAPAQRIPVPYMPGGPVPISQIPAAAPVYAAAATPMQTTRPMQPPAAHAPAAYGVPVVGSPPPAPVPAALPVMRPAQPGQPRQASVAPPGFG